MHMWLYIQVLELADGQPPLMGTGLSTVQVFFKIATSLSSPTLKTPQLPFFSFPIRAVLCSLLFNASIFQLNVFFCCFFCFASLLHQTKNHNPETRPQRHAVVAACQQAIGFRTVVGLRPWACAPAAVVEFWVDVAERVFARLLCFNVPRRALLDNS